MLQCVVPLRDVECLKSQDEKLQVGGPWAGSSRGFGAEHCPRFSPSPQLFFLELELFYSPLNSPLTTSIMLAESFVASIGSAEKPSANAPHKDAGVFFHDYQPLPALKSVLKKSNSRQNALAVNSTHVFVAQADKAVVHVYNIDRGNQEAVVPFPEKITSLTLVGDPEDAGILALGNEGGRVILWEVG